MTAGLTAEDRAAIADRLGRYVWALDTGDVEAVAACFTPDGVAVDTQGNRYEGSNGIRSFAAEFIGRADFRGRQHQVTHLFWDGDRQRCAVTSYWTVFKWYFEENRKTVAGLGYSRDVCVKIGGAWLIAERHLHWLSDRHGPWFGPSPDAQS